MKNFSDILFDVIEKGSFEVSSDFANLNGQLRVDEFSIQTEEDARLYSKPIGRYALLSTPDILSMFKEDVDYTTNILYKILKKLVGGITCKDKILIVGLGNRHISSDSLGAKVVGKINITINNKNLPRVMAIAPSVLGLTGIETFDIVSGVVNNIKPTHILLIDSLCASNEERLGKSIQVTNTGLCPGSGIGNKRKCIDNTMAKHVYSIGVPLLIFASTFISSACEKNNIDISAIDSVMQKLKKLPNYEEEISVLQSIKNVMLSKFDDCIVSLKDIEECVDILSNIIASAINRLLGVEGIY